MSNERLKKFLKGIHNPAYVYTIGNSGSVIQLRKPTDKSTDTYRREYDNLVMFRRTWDNRADAEQWARSHQKYLSQYVEMIDAVQPKDELQTHKELQSESIVAHYRRRGLL